MSKIDQRISLYPAVSERTDENFYDDYENWTMHGANVVAEEQNIMADQMNAVADEISMKQLQITASIGAAQESMLDIKSSTESIQTDINTKKSQIDIKHTQIMGYVIPTSATYSEDTIDKKIRMSQVLNLTNSI